MKRILPLLFVVAISLSFGAIVLRSELTAPTAAALIHRKIVRGADTISVTNSHGAFGLYRKGEVEECREDFSCEEPWFLQDFTGIPLSVEKVQLTLEALATARVLQTVPGAGELSLYGLDPPELKVLMRGKGFRERTIFIGKRSEYLGGRYALSVDGKTVLLVEDSLLPLIEMKQHGYFALSPQVFNPESIESFQVQTSAEKFRVYRKEASWEVLYHPEKPPVPASDGKVGLFLHGLSRMAAGRLVPISTAEGKSIAEQLDVQVALTHTGSEVPQLISLNLSARLELPEVALPKDQIVFLPDTSRAVYFTPFSDVITLFEGSAGFRRRRILDFEVRDFSRAILYNRSEGVFEISRTEEGWTVNGKPGDTPFVKDLFRELSEVECSGFIPKDLKVGTDEMTARIWVKGKKDPYEAQFVSLGSGVDSYYVKSSAETRGCYVDQRSLRRVLPRGEILYRKAATKVDSVLDAPAE